MAKKKDGPKPVAGNGYWHGYKIEPVKVADLVPYENNPRINADAVPAVVASIRSFGFISPIVVDAHNVIVNGHTRRLAAIELGMDVVPCIRPTDLTPKHHPAHRHPRQRRAGCAGGKGGHGALHGFCRRSPAHRPQRPF